MVPPVPNVSGRPIRSNEATVNSSAAVLTPGAIGAGTPAPGLAPPPLTNAQVGTGETVTSNGELNGVKQGRILKKPVVTVVIWFRIFETCGHGDTWKSRYPLGSGSSGFCMRIEAK